jgi:EAL domain-containing protein (putative c-di-GMP-specific phosphodiesterase class I)
MDDKFFARMDSELTGWPDPVARLQQAIEKDEFTLYCQPILALGAGGGYPMGEVLIRLREEESALLPPGDFLPVFEHYRMMPRLDRWVVRNALKRLAAGSRIPRLTVNVSGQALADGEFPAYVAAQLEAQKVAAGSLLFEIDESDALEHHEAAAAFAAAIRKLGCKVLVDGFGRRAVSFSVLKGISADFVKVDGSITRKVLANETARNKMNAVLRVSEAIGFGVVAECVEDQDVLTRLKALNVGFAQGFGIYQPHPIEKVAGS